MHTDMWSFTLIIVGAQLCLGLPQELQQEQQQQEQQQQVQRQQQEVDVLTGTRVNCRVTATVTYPLTTGGDDLPTVKCVTKCIFTTKEKDKSYFIGYVYRHFERLEKEYGLMVEIRYNKGTSKGCNLVPVANNEEVFSAQLNSNNAHAPTTLPLKTLPTKVSPKTVPTKLPVAHDPKPTTLLTEIQPTSEPTKLQIKHNPEPTTLSPIAPQTNVPTKLPIENDPKPTTLSPIAPQTNVPTKLPLKQDPKPTTLSPIVPPTSVHTKLQIEEDSEAMATKLPIKHNPKPTTLSPIVPTAKEHTANNIKNGPTSMEQPKVPQPTATLFEEFESTIPDLTTSLDSEHDWVLIGKAYFHISKIHGDWSDGQHYCADIGATLASVRSQEEQDGLAELVGGDAWIGLHDMQQEGKHAWEDQTALNFTNWEPGQPNNSRVGWFKWWNGEDCVEMKEKYNFRWNDEDCDIQNIYICRRDDELLEGSTVNESVNEISINNN